MKLDINQKCRNCLFACSFIYYVTRNSTDYSYSLQGVPITSALTGNGSGIEYGTPSIF